MDLNPERVSEKTNIVFDRTRAEREAQTQAERGGCSSPSTRTINSLSTFLSDFFL